MTAAWWMLVALAVLAIGYRFYSAFIAAKVLCLEDARVTPAHTLNDGHNFHPTNKWVLFGHHFAAITGAGPLIGPVLAAQFGFYPGFAWILFGVVWAMAAVGVAAKLFNKLKHPLWSTGLYVGMGWMALFAAGPLFAADPRMQLNGLNMLPDLDAEPPVPYGPVPVVTPREISNAVLFLASDEARYITGVALPVDAGNTNKP